jgi:diadenosine tetraphosphate (Ap4A) HIT family hydrolase
MAFTLHPQLQKDTLPIGDLRLNRVLLMNNRHFPWLILVPRQENLQELFDLSPVDYMSVMQEVRETSERFAALYKPQKINVAALGNAVPQLHIHIIARFESDAAWPAPVWNTVYEPYENSQIIEIVQHLQKTLGL